LGGESPWGLSNAAHKVQEIRQEPRKLSLSAELSKEKIQAITAWALATKG